MSLSKDNCDIIERYYYPKRSYNLQLRDTLTGKAHTLSTVLYDFLTHEIFATSAIFHS